MGFFSSRRHDTDVLSNSSNAQSPSSSPSSGIIRSRFYGRNKGKAREADPTPTRVTSPLAAAEPRMEPNLNDTPRTTNGHRAMDDSGSGSRDTFESSLHSPAPQQASMSPDAASARASTDAITVVLAQQLSQLASANAAGLLDDDEYRLLRLNLFERLGSPTNPMEISSVPTAGPSRPRPPQTPQRNGSVRAPSVQSKGTTSSSISGLFRRNTGRSKPSTDAETLHSDSTSLLSANSNSPNAFTRRLLRMSLPKNSSTVSLRPDGSLAAHDNGSTTHIASPGRSDGLGKPITPSISRSSTTRSKRKAPPPPSAFHHRANGAEQKRIHTGILDDDLDDGVLKSSKEIRAQIEAVEAEGRRLMDAFNGLELSALTRKSQSGHISALPSTTHFLQGLDSLDSGWSSHLLKDPDGMSMHSITSNGTSLSTQRSPVRSPRTVPNTPLVSQPISLGRKSSLSSISSKGRSGTTSGAPYLPALPSSLGRLWSGSSSSVNLTRSTNHLPLAPVAEGDSRESIEGHRRHLRLDTSPSVLIGPSPTSPRRNGFIGDDGDITALEAEMAEIRRRRAEVMGRYEERLGYLRAKLKGAELHEKLLRL